MSKELFRLIGSLRSIATTLLGIALSVVPLALWVAWTETILLAIIAVGATSAVLLVVLAEREVPLPDGSNSVHRPYTRPTIPDESVADLHQIFPLTYHHSLKASARFARAMEKISRRMKAPDADRQA